MHRILLFAVFLNYTGHIQAQNSEGTNFKEYDVRVIRPKFFQKTGAFELGAQLGMLTNETFINTALLTGVAGYHFNENFALQLSGAYAYSIDRSEKSKLNNRFNINPLLYRTNYLGEAVIQISPMYGKAQLPKGNLLYFDNYLALGGGMLGANRRYSEFCTNRNSPADRTFNYPSAVVGFGQRIFYRVDAALNWEIRYRTLFYNSADESCFEGASGGSTTSDQLLLQLGYSKYL